jgi:8-oxo-dGTP pyrophosphatase MutT (NUDIX family)
MTKMARPASIRPFSDADTGTSINGWKSLPAPLSGLVNTKGWGAIRIVVQKILESTEGGARQDLYDQVLLVENPGAVVVCLSDERVGLVSNFRFTGNRLTDDSDYVKLLTQENRWAELLESLGQWHWELPRGLAPVAAETDLKSYITRTAKMEAKEEAGFEIVDPRICGKVNANTTFFAHAQLVVSASIAEVGESNPEPAEFIGAMRLFSKSELRQLTEDGGFDDGLSLAALAVAGYHF